MHGHSDKLCYKSGAVHYLVYEKASTAYPKNSRNCPVRFLLCSNPFLSKIFIQIPSLSLAVFFVLVFSIA